MNLRNFTTNCLKITHSFKDFDSQRLLCLIIYCYENKDVLLLFIGNPSDKLGEKAYRKHLDDEEDDTDILAKKLSRLHLGQDHNENVDELEELSDSDDDSLSYTQSPVPDDTKRTFL